METEVKPAAPPARSPRALVPYRLTVEQFLRIVDTGVLDDVRVELIRGRLVERMVKHEPHNAAVDALARRLRSLLEPAYSVREEKSVRLGDDSRPEPDLAVTRGEPRSCGPKGPQAEHLALVAEVSDSTYAKDRGPMWSLYAGAGVPVYWVVNIPKKQVEVYSEPAGEGRAAGYGKAAVFAAGSEAPVVVDGREFGKIAVNDILP